MNLVIVSCHYPPSCIANAQRPALLAREMLSRGHNVLIVTRGVTSRDTDRPEPISSGNAVLQIDRVLDPVDAWRQRWGGSWLWDRIVRRLWPDDAMPWTLRAAQHLRKVANAGPVIACINPVSSLLFANANHDPRPRLFFDYQESVSPFREVVKYDMILHRLLSRKLARLEAAALRRSQGAAFNSQANRDAYVIRGLIDSTRAAYIPHFCDSNPYSGSTLDCSGTMVISYVGCFTRDRSPEAFLRALRRLLDLHRDAAARIRVHLFGGGLGLYKRMSMDLGLQDNVKEMGTREHQELLPILATSHMLLLVAAPKHVLFFPSKCVEYIAARRPILSVTAPGSEVEGVLRRSQRQQWMSSYGDVEAIAANLEEAWCAFKEGRIGYALPEALVATGSEVASSWLELLAVADRSLDGRM